ncbi:MAG: hypothetical protein ACRCXZ_01870 [Patescibacteria group bacterium]
MIKFITFQYWSKLSQSKTGFNTPFFQVGNYLRELGNQEEVDMFFKKEMVNQGLDANVIKQHFETKSKTLEN